MVEFEEELLDGSFDTAQSVCKRREATSDPTRMNVLYMLYKSDSEEMRVEELPATLEDMRPLIDTSLIGHVPHPDSTQKGVIRLTTLGRLEVKGFLRSLQKEDLP